MKERVEQVRQQRTTASRGRDRRMYATVGIVGYTNAGKSTLLNALVGSEVAKAEDKLFATLDPTSRQVKLGDGQIAIVTDTVGFIHKLPHQLVDAFRATLEEVNRADVLLEVVDASDPHLARAPGDGPDRPRRAGRRRQAAPRRVQQGRPRRDRRPERRRARAGARGVRPRQRAHGLRARHAPGRDRRAALVALGRPRRQHPVRGGRAARAGPRAGHGRARVRRARRAGQRPGRAGAGGRADGGQRRVGPDAGVDERLERDGGRDRKPVGWLTSSAAPARAGSSTAPTSSGRSRRGRRAVAGARSGRATAWSVSSLLLETFPDRRFAHLELSTRGGPADAPSRARRDPPRQCRDRRPASSTSRGCRGPPAASSSSTARRSRSRRPPGSRPATGADRCARRPDADRDREPDARGAAPERSRATASRTRRSTPTGCRSWPPGARGRSSWRLPERVSARLRGNPVDNDLRKRPRTSKLVDNRARQPRSQPVTYVLPEGATRTKATIRVLASGLEATGSAVPSGVFVVSGTLPTTLGPAAGRRGRGAGPRSGAISRRPVPQHQARYRSVPLCAPIVGTLWTTLVKRALQPAKSWINPLARDARPPVLLVLPEGATNI